MVPLPSQGEVKERKECLLIYILPFIIGGECLAAILAGLLTEKTVRQIELDLMYIHNSAAIRTADCDFPLVHKEKIQTKENCSCNTDNYKPYPIKFIIQIDETFAADNSMLC